MADTKISGLTALTQLDPADELPFADVSVTTTKKVTHENLKDWRLSTAGLYLPSVAGFNPAAAGEVGYDSTQRTIRSNEGFSDGNLSRLLQAQNVTNQSWTTIDAATVGTTETAFGGQFVVPANYLIQDKVLRLTFLTEQVSGGTANSRTFRLRWGGVAGTIMLATLAGTPGNSATRRMVLSFYVQGTAAAGAAASVHTMMHNCTGGAGANIDGSTTEPVALATNAQNTIVLTITFGNNNAGNTEKLFQMTVEELN